MDDTLYDEATYVESSLRAVAKYLSGKYGLSKNILFRDLMNILNLQARGQIFDTLLFQNNIFSKKEVKKCVSVYRKNIPKITMFIEATDVLDSLVEHPKYLVSDGNKIVQSIKADALGTKAYFKKRFLTHRYGIKHAKPSTYCFSLIKKMEGCKWSEMVYVADDPNKDFVNLNPLGVETVRVLTGRFKKQKAKKGYDANFHINNLAELLPVLGIKN